MSVKFNIENDGYIVNGNMYVPMDKDNSEYKIIQAWIADGNVVEPALTPDEIVAAELEGKKAKLHQELDAIVGDLTPAESMYLMLQYGFAKMQPSDAEDDSGVSLTPTGEDIITWGDRIAQELGQKLTELRELDK